MLMWYETVRIRGDRPPEWPVSGLLRGEIDFDLGWASGMGEARGTSGEAVSQVVVEDGVRTWKELSSRG